MRTSAQQRDISSDAGAYATGLQGEQSRAAGEAFDEGAPIYERADAPIANNQNGGAGFFAEAHHTASLNIDANYKDVSVSADRLGSTAFGSPDIVLNNGEQFNPKFYDTASGSYHAGAELVDDGSGLAAKYAGQTILVPSDQLGEAQQMHAHAIQEAYDQGDATKAHALESVRYDDHIHSGGVESQPLTYEGAHAGADGIRHGDLPGYVGEDTGLFGTAGESAMLAASIALATTIGPQLVGDAAKVLRGQLTTDEAIARLQRSFGDAQTRSALGWASARGAGAATLTFLDAADPTGAAFLANMVIDTIQLSARLKDGSLSPGEFGNAMLDKVKDRAAYTALTAGAFWLVGPVGLLVPIIVRRMVSDAALQREAINAWNGVSGAMRAELESRIKGAALLDKIGQHYRSAEASSTGSTRATLAIADDLTEIQKLLGYEPGPKPSPSD